jgi:hypothetical protein
MAAMKAIGWMTAVTVGVWGTASLLAGADLADDLGFGMLGPLAAAIATWLLIEQAVDAAPSVLQRHLLQAFALKVLFFAGYVAVMLRVVHVQPAAFVSAFTVTFLALHLTEAVLLQRRSARRMTSAIS